MMFFHLEAIKHITFLRLETTKLTTPAPLGAGWWARLFFVFLFSFVLYAYWAVALITATRLMRPCKQAKIGRQ